MNGIATAVETVVLVRLQGVSVDDSTLTFDLEDGRSISVPIGWYPRLAYATQEERDRWELAGAGYGVHWPDLDEDIGVEGILLGKRSLESPASFARWLEARGHRSASQ